MTDPKTTGTATEIRDFAAWLCEHDNGVSDFGALLRAWLDALDVSANELGRRMGGQERAVRKWLVAPRGPYASTQARIAAALGLSLATFHGGPNSATREQGLRQTDQPAVPRTGRRVVRERPPPQLDRWCQVGHTPGMATTRLREIRKSKGISAAQLARHGVSIRNIFRIENEQGYDPRLSTVKALAAALDVSVDQLISHIPEASTPSTGCGPTRDTDQPASVAVSPIHQGA